MSDKSSSDSNAVAVILQVPPGGFLKVFPNAESHRVPDFLRDN